MGVFHFVWRRVVLFLLWPIWLPLAWLYMARIAAAPWANTETRGTLWRHAWSCAVVSLGWKDSQ